MRDTDEFNNGKANSRFMPRDDDFDKIPDGKSSKRKTPKKRNEFKWDAMFSPKRKFSSPEEDSELPKTQDETNLTPVSPEKDFENKPIDIESNSDDENLFEQLENFQSDEELFGSDQTENIENLYDVRIDWTI